ncbi:hypothetical protein FQR65_LT18670 [Abscondita terminalis]|nr:hypothetical protein FQR65_LT18670 [Abscondita terminalis]
MGLYNYGGGASGLGSALELQRELTSSRSTKLVHGGVRYLAQGNIDLVKEALYERGLLAKNAAHLVKNQSFIIPNYNWWGGIYYKIGLSVYDFLAGKLSLGLLKNESNKITGVIAEDQFTKERYEIKAKAVVNATGVFTNEILNMSNPKHGKFVVPSQGIHFVLDKSFLKSNDAIMIPKTSDGRVLFVVPWHERALIGLRPLAAPKDGSKSTKEVSRSHKFIVAERTCTI